MKAPAVAGGRGGRMLRGVRTWVPRRVVVLAAAAVALALTQVWMRNRVRAVAYDLSRIQHVQNELAHREREAQLQLELERDPDLLRARALRDLGMVEPQPGQVIDVMGGPGPAPPAAAP